MSFVSCSKLNSEVTNLQDQIDALAAADTVEPASTTTAGVIKIATQAQIAAGTGNEAALTPANTLAALNDTATTGGSPMQKAVVNAVAQAIGADTGATQAVAAAIGADSTAINSIADGIAADATAQATLADSIKDDVAAAIGADPASAAALMPGIVDALIADPAKLQALANALAAIIPDVFE